MASSIRLRTKTREGITTVRAIIRHPMETGFDKNPATGELIPVHFIEEVICRHNDKVIMRCDWSRAVSKNPYLSFAFAGGKPGDSVSISWTDSEGESESAKISIS